MKALTFVEIDIDYCSLTYGTAPCTAALGVTGSDRCYNTIATCQARAAFANAPVTLRFAIDTLALPESGIEALPYLTAVNYTPPTISLGKDLGTRSSVTANFADRPHPDTGAGFDKYLSQRAYDDPFYRGTFFGKFATRQKYIKGRPFRLIQGYLGQAIGDMETRHFVIEDFTGPDRQGNYSITAKDALKLLDGDRAQAPALSLGYLSADISSVATSATMLPSGIGNASYPASGHVSIGGKEICSFTRSGDVLTLTRARFNTPAQAHDGEDRVQLCNVYSGENPADVLYDLFVNYAGVPAAYITIADWYDDIDEFYRRNISAVLAEPVAVKTLVSEIIEQVGLAIWWDETAQKIRLQVLHQIQTADTIFNEDVIIEGTFRSQEQPEKRISQVWNYYGQINPLKSVNDTDNYRSTLVTVDPQSESDYGQPAIKKIFSRWIPELAQPVASRINNIQLGRFLNPPRRLSMSLFRANDGSSITPIIGNGYSILAKPLQDASGAETYVGAQITRLTPHPDRFDIELEEVLFSILDSEDLLGRALVAASDTNNIDIRAQHDLVYPPPAVGDTVTLFIYTGVTIASTSVASPAVTVGSWPTRTQTGNISNGSPIVTAISVNTSGLTAGMGVTGSGIPAGTRILTVDSATQFTLTNNATATTTGVTLTVGTVIVRIVNRGSIIGVGGHGGTGSFYSGSRIPALNGSAGGPALYLRYPVDLFVDQGLGQIYGGGGGGGGAGVLQLNQHVGGGGGGGAGIPGGNGASRGGNAGSRSSGGVGGGSFASYGWWQFPFETGVRGGSGGGPGAAGGSGGNHGGQAFEQQVGSGGAAGAAIDGASFIKKTGTGDIRGSQVN